MKWLKDREKFINEAKIRDLILPIQSKTVGNYWGERFLDYEEVTPTKKIQQGKWKLSEEDKMKVLGVYLDCNMNNVYKIFNNISDKFAMVVNQSVNTSLLSEQNKIIMSNFDIKNPTIDQIIIIYDNVFRRISAGETLSDIMVQKNDKGIPIKDVEGNLIRIKKQKGDLVFTNNLVNINTFISGFNGCFQDEKIDEDTFKSGDINDLRNMASVRENSEYRVDFNIFNKDIYLSINHNPKDILNMSISKFYSSCQHLYSGGYRSQLLGNVFDPNSIPAFLVFETPIFWGDDKISDVLPLSRMMIRSIETFDDNDNEKKIFFDRSYPDRMKNIFDEIIKKYTENNNNYSGSYYYFTPDIDLNDSIETPYMDRLNYKRYKAIGKNIKSLHLVNSFDWSSFKILPDCKIKEITIETTNIPDFTNIVKGIEWIKFKYLNLKSMEPFSNIKSEYIAFDKCKLNLSIINDLYKDIRKIKIINCEVSGNLDFSNFNQIDELQLIYTLEDDNQLLSILENKNNIKKLVISGDIANKKIINEIKKSGINVEVTGLFLNKKNKK